MKKLNMTIQSPDSVIYTQRVSISSIKLTVGRRTVLGAIDNGNNVTNHVQNEFIAYLDNIDLEYTYIS